MEVREVAGRIRLELLQSETTGGSGVNTVGQEARGKRSFDAGATVSRGRLFAAVFPPFPHLTLAFGPRVLVSQTRRAVQSKGCIVGVCGGLGW